MKLPSPQFFLFLVFSILLPSWTPSAVGSDGRDERQVRVAYVEGDVRLSRGNGKRVDLDKPWEQAQVGEPVEQGFALATRGGRTEVEFDDGSVVYLAENSLLLFRELSAPRERNLTRMVLPTGTATFSLQPVRDEDFFIQTPTDTLQFSAPETFYSRVDAYLDATAITAQADKGENLTRINDPNIQIAKGQTVFFQNGETIELPASNSCQPTLIGFPRHIEPWLLPPCEQVLKTPHDFHTPPLEIPSFPEGTQTQRPPANSLQGNWDNWVSTRVQQEKAAMAAALEASGLPSPIPGLVDLYKHGSFFVCGEYGTCWEPTQPEPQVDGASQSPVPSAQSPPPNATPPGFQPQTVQWEETWGTSCGPMLRRSISHVAHTPQELQKLLRRKELAERSLPAGNFYSVGCYSGYWFLHHGHYARVITPRHPPKCPPRGCKPVHPPRPRWVQVGRQVGFVPRHPKDVAGKPPLNLRNGVIVPPSKPGQPIRLLAPDSSEKISVLEKAPKQFQSGFSFPVAAVTAPEIHARLVLENTRQGSPVTASRSLTPITYDYKSRTFTMPGSSAPGAHSKPVAVGGITPNGKIASFADGHSSTYAESFGRTGAAASYNSAGSHGSGSSYAGGGHSSGSSSGGGHSSGSYASGGSSSGSSSGGYTHSSAGAASSSFSSSSSSNSASSPSSSNAGGGSHH